MQNSNSDNDRLISRLLSIINILLFIIGVLVVAIISMPFILQQNEQTTRSSPVAQNESANTDTIQYWTPPDINAITDSNLKKRVEYGKELISNTSKYFGPKGSLLHLTNGMNCQNCHLQAGSSIYGNNFGSVASLYPRFKPRRGGMETAMNKVSDCFERSLNGRAPDSNSVEMMAMLAYLDYIGSNVSKGKKAAGSGLKELAYLDRAADPGKGQAVYINRCQSCHQPAGGGQFAADSSGFTYPPLWGVNSFNDAAGLFRISNFAKYIKVNMPQGTTYKAPLLTDEEAWDVAAFVLSQQRPHAPKPRDWPDISSKPIDHPFGPYRDSFSEKQHKYGPFKPIQEAQKQKTEPAKAK